MTASGALGYDGRGWSWELPLKFLNLLDPSLFVNVIKSLTRLPRRGNLRMYNPFGCFRFIPNGTVNAIGLTNPGVEWWCQNIGPNIDSLKIPLVGSIYGEPDELYEMAEMLNNYDLVGMEVNASCPNTADDTLENCDRVIESCIKVREISRFPIILKVSVAHNIGNIIPRIKGYTEALSINSVPWDVAFPNQRSPLAHLGSGGVSGKAAQPFTWDLVRKLVDLTDIPVIGPSVWDFEDIDRLRRIGVKAISFGAVHIPYPWRPTRYVRRDQRRREQ